MSQVCSISIATPSRETYPIAKCRWTLNAPVPDKWVCFYTVDAVFEPIHQSSTDGLVDVLSFDVLSSDIFRKGGFFVLSGLGGEYGEALTPTSNRRFAFLLDLITKLHTTDGAGSLHKFIVPAKDGVLIRSDYLETRLALAEFAKSVISFLEPCECVRALGYESQLARPNFADILSTACCGVASSTSTCKNDLEYEIYQRLSTEWIIPASAATKRVVAFLEGPPKKETAKTLLNSAKFLNIDLVVLDAPGHWLEQPENAFQCRAFIPMDMTKDEGLAKRGFEALVSAGLAGIVEAVVSCRDSCLAPAAKMMGMLGLCTADAPPLAFHIATDKYLTRMLNNDLPCCFQFSSMEELYSQMSLHGIGSSPEVFPLVVKPCHGGGSEGVSKVHSVQELVDCVQQWIDMENISYRHGTAMVAETYVDGPEVDANFVLFDGEILFFELIDDFPCDADRETANCSATFVEGGMFYPSGLPDQEYELIRSSVHSMLLEMGFRTGVFHCEARVRNSSVEYSLSLTNEGLSDLVPSQARSITPSVFLLEVNARPCGLQGVIPTRNTYGVDYYDMLLLCGLRDRFRATELARKFDSAPLYWTELVYITSPVGGIFASDEPCNEMLRRFPHLKEHVSYYWNLRKQGDMIPHPSQKRDVLQPWIAAMLVYSRKSRLEALTLAQSVRAKFSYKVLSN